MSFNNYSSMGRTQPKNEQANQAALLMHLSQLLGHTALPVLGWLVPILIWQFKKSEHPDLDAHGKSIANWIFSELIYGAVCTFLAFTVIGLIAAIPLGIALYLLGIILPIVGAMRARDGELYEYPLTLQFFR